MPQLYWARAFWQIVNRQKKSKNSTHNIIYFTTFLTTSKRPLQQANVVLSLLNLLNCKNLKFPDCWIAGTKCPITCKWWDRWSRRLSSNQSCATTGSSRIFSTWQEMTLDEDQISSSRTRNLSSVAVTFVTSFWSPLKAVQGHRRSWPEVLSVWFLT